MSGYYEMNILPALFLIRKDFIIRGFSGEGSPAATSKSRDV